MLATSFIQKSTIEVNLSSGKTVEIENKKNTVVLILNKKGQVYLNKKLINISNIRNEITNIIEKNPKYKILIKSHKKIAVQKVIRLIEEVRLAGTDNIKLIAGDTNKVLKELDLQNIDFTFLDGGHSYQTVINDLTILYEIMKDKKKVILCDDYGKESYIPEVEKAINDFAKKNNLKLNLIENRFAEIIT